MTVLAWVFFAIAAVAAVPAFGLLFIGRKALDMIDGHLKIAFGIVLMFASAGALALNADRLTPLIAIACVVGMGAGFALWFFGRQRAREVNGYLNAVERAQAKQEASDA